MHARTPSAVGTDRNRPRRGGSDLSGAAWTLIKDPPAAEPVTVASIDGPALGRRDEGVRVDEATGEPLAVANGDAGVVLPCRAVARDPLVPRPMPESVHASASMGIYLAAEHARMPAARASCAP